MRRKRRRTVTFSRLLVAILKSKPFRQSNQMKQLKKNKKKRLHIKYKPTQFFGQPRIVVPDVCCDHLQRLKDVVAKLFTNVCCTFASSQFMSVCFNLSSFQKIIEENISSKLLVLNIFIQIGKKLTWKGGLPKKFMQKVFCHCKSF